MRRVIGVLSFVLLASCTERPLRSSAVERGDGAAPNAPARADAGAPRAAAAPPAVDAGAAEAVADVSLPIPARNQAAEAPPSGWCGETAIQEGLLYLGVWAPQGLINKAGKPIHPDLYSPEIPVALSELGVRYTFYSRSRGFDAFSQWVRTALDEGDPVLAGVKILPTEHPEWGLDHFVLVVGHGKSGLLVNTTWGTREWVGDTHTKGLSLANAFYGIRLGGLALPPNALAARITLLEESKQGMKMRVSCMGTKAGAKYRLERRTSRAEAKPEWTEEGTSTELTVEAARPSRFQCVPL